MGHDQGWNASRLKDLRLFHVGGWHGEHEALAFGRRLCWWLNGEGFGIGHDPCLYVTLSSELPDGRVEAEPPKFTPDDWWFREVAIGVPDEFPEVAEAVTIAQQRIVDCLKALKPADSDLIEKSSEIVAATGDVCRFLLKVKETTKESVEISTTIGTWPEQSLLYVGVTDKSTGTYREAPPARLRFYDDGVLLAGKVRIDRRRVGLAARAALPAQMVAEQRGGDPSWNITEFHDAVRPLTSSPLRFR